MVTWGHHSLCPQSHYCTTQISCWGWPASVWGQRSPPENRSCKLPEWGRSQGSWQSRPEWPGRTGGGGRVWKMQERKSWESTPGHSASATSVVTLCYNQTTTSTQKFSANSLLNVSVPYPTATGESSQVSWVQLLTIFFFYFLLFSPCNFKKVFYFKMLTVLLLQLLCAWETVAYNWGRQDHSHSPLLHTRVQSVPSGHMTWEQTVSEDQSLGMEAQWLRGVACCLGNIQNL